VDCTSLSGKWQAAHESLSQLSAAWCVQVAEQIMLATQTQLGVINTAYIERLQATLRGWLPMAFRRTRCPARSADRVEDALFWTGVLVCRSSHAGCHASQFDRPCVDD
jgi:hypothetical protein